MSQTHDLGKKKAPVVLEPDDDLGDHFDQSWFDEQQRLRDDGLLAEIRKVALENPKTRRHLVPLLRRFAAEEPDKASR